MCYVVSWEAIAILQPRALKSSLVVWVGISAADEHMGKAKCDSGCLLMGKQPSPGLLYLKRGDDATLL